MNIEAWQLSILVTAGIILAEFALNAALRRKNSLALRKRVRTGALGLLAALTIVVGVVALGPSLADQLASVAAAVAAVVAVWLTYRSFQAPHSGDVGGTGAPDVPASRPAPDEPAGAPTTSEHGDTASVP
jgi:hypothetical protein